MTDFLSNYHLLGLAIGLCAFLTIGVCHPLVIKGEYHYGNRMKWVFACAGIVALVFSVIVRDLFWSSLLGVAAFSFFWGIHEVTQQGERVRKGWFPRNPKRTYPWDNDNAKSEKQ